MSQEPTNEDMELALEIDNILVDKVLPVLDDIDEKYPDASAYFAMYINCIHILIDQGWTMEELMQEVKDHAVIHEHQEPGELH